MNLFSVLVNPQREELEPSDRALVCSAANVLGVGEFQVLQLAYRSWFGHELPEATGDELFSSFMIRNQAPHWARHFARAILTRDKAGVLDPTQSSWHCYDYTYPRTPPRRSIRKFLAASSVVGLTLIGAIVLATVMSTNPTSVFPPFFERSHLPAEAGAQRPGTELRR